MVDKLAKVISLSTVHDDESDDGLTVRVLHMDDGKGGHAVAYGLQNDGGQRLALSQAQLDDLVRLRQSGVI